MVPGAPLRQSAFKLQGIRPLTEPGEFFFECSHEPFRTGVSFRVVIAREGLCDTECRAGFHKGDRCGLTPIVTDQRHTLPLNPLPGVDAALPALAPEANAYS